MFQVKFFVEDRFLGEALKRLAGIARGVEHAYVPNLEPERGSKANGHAPKVKMSAADSLDMLMKELRKRKLGDFKSKVVQEVVGEMGFSPTSYSHFITGAIKAGFVGKKKNPEGNGVVYYLKPEK